MSFIKHLIEMDSMKCLLREDSGATAIEYGFAVAAIAAFQLVGTSLSSIFNTVATDL